MKVLITGASGLLGQCFIEQYAQDCTMTALTRNHDKHNTVDRYGCTWLATDYSPESLNEIFLQEFDAVLHLAAERLYSGNKLCFNNVILDKNIFENLGKYNIKNSVFISSRGIYGNKPQPWLESDVVAPLNDYSLAKSLSEQTAHFYNQNHGLNIKILRLAQLLSPREYKGSLLDTYFSNVHSDRALNVTVTGISREYLYIKDAASALYAALMHQEKAGIFNVGSGETVTIEKIAQSIATQAGKPHLVELQHQPKVLSECSLMDSTKFREMFNWQPAFTFDDAVRDILWAQMSESDNG